MNIDAFWQANRKFIIGLVAGIIAFFILLAVVAGGATDRFSTASISVSRAKRAGSNASQYSVAQVRELEGILTRLDVITLMSTRPWACLRCRRRSLSLLSNICVR